MNNFLTAVWALAQSPLFLFLAFFAACWGFAYGWLMLGYWWTRPRNNN